MKQLAFVHIPKTGGTSIINAMKRKHVVVHCDMNEVPTGDWDIAAGHFYPSTFEGFPRVTFIRNPIERAISHYSHLHQRLKNGEDRIIVYPGGTVSFSHRTTLLDFVDYVGCLQNHYLEDWKQFDFIGIVEDFKYSIEWLNKKFKLNIVPRHDNKTKHVHVNDHEMSALYDILEPEIKVYEQIKRRYGSK
jgi:hypothetical protein